LRRVLMSLLPLPAGQMEMGQPAGVEGLWRGAGEPPPTRQTDASTCIDACRLLLLLSCLVGGCPPTELLLRKYRYASSSRRRGAEGRGRPLMKEQRSPSAGWGRTGIINSRNTKSHTTLTDPHRHFRPRRALSPRAAAAACASPPSAPCVVAARDTSTTFPATNACYALALPVYPQPPPLPRRQHHSPPTAKLLAHPGRVHVDPKWASLRCWRFSSPSCS
jgi:hypothetical protein